MLSRFGKRHVSLAKLKINARFTHRDRQPCFPPNDAACALGIAPRQELCYLARTGGMLDVDRPSVSRRPTATGSLQVAGAAVIMDLERHAALQMALR
jgi:hypothetical protein